MKALRAGLLGALCLGTAGAAFADGLGARERAQLRRQPPAAAAPVSGNAVAVTQDGSGNAGAIVQNGVGNEAWLRQYGKDNDGRIVQDGSYNQGCLVQLGKGLSGEIAQGGDGNSLGIVQTKKGVREVPAEMCAFEGNAPGYWKRMGRIKRN
jgi:hypothetical protein